VFVLKGGKGKAGKAFINKNGNQMVADFRFIMPQITRINNDTHSFQ
jgi:hypothetical protein